MAEHSFQEVMRQWGRYCKGYTDNHADDCSECPFEINGSCNSYAKDNAQYAEQIEKHIMAWAAEHPEPQYPTWTEWLQKQGFVELKNGQFVKQTENEYGYVCKTVAVLTEKAEVPIPADLAQKLGIEPKK